MNIEFTKHDWDEFEYWVDSDAEIVDSGKNC